jgi:hypothetical protein
VPLDKGKQGCANDGYVDFLINVDDEVESHERARLHRLVKQAWTEYAIGSPIFDKVLFSF